MKKQHNSTRKLLVFNQFQKFKKRLETSIEKGRFYRLTKRKQGQLVSRLNRYARRLGMSLRMKISGATLVLGLVASTSASSQSFTEIRDTNSPFIIYDSPLFAQQGYNAPAFVDIDGDGDEDVFIGQGRYLKNVGGATNPIYEEQSANNPLDAFYNGSDSYDLVFTDLDNDDDFDAVYISNDSIKYLRNDGNALNPNFSMPAASPFADYNANSPTQTRFSFDVADVDGDGDQDLFLGGSDSITYVVNTGDAFNPNFEAGVLPIPAVNLGTGESVYASFADLDDDGDLDYVLAQYANIQYYKNVGDATNPSFQEQTGAANPFNPTWPKRLLYPSKIGANFFQWYTTYFLVGVCE